MRDRSSLVMKLPPPIEVEIMDSGKEPIGHVVQNSVILKRERDHGKNVCHRGKDHCIVAVAAGPMKLQRERN